MDPKVEGLVTWGGIKAVGLLLGSQDFADEIQTCARQFGNMMQAGIGLFSTRSESGMPIANNQREVAVPVLRIVDAPDNPIRDYHCPHESAWTISRLAPLHGSEVGIPNR